jgi:mannose PTS system EIIA component
VVGVLIISHGPLGQALVDAATMITGHTDDVRAISFQPGQGIEDLDAAVRSALDEVWGTGGALCLVDLPGGSPARVAASLVPSTPGLEVISGVNLPMLVEVLLLRDAGSARELAIQAHRLGGEGIVDVGMVLREALSHSAE